MCVLLNIRDILLANYNISMAIKEMKKLYDIEYRSESLVRIERT